MFVGCNIYTNAPEVLRSSDISYLVQQTAYVNISSLNEALPEAPKLVTLILMIPAICAAVERSFIPLERIKTLTSPDVTEQTVWVGPDVQRKGRKTQRVTFYDSVKELFEHTGYRSDLKCIKISVNGLQILFSFIRQFESVGKAVGRLPPARDAILASCAMLPVNSLIHFSKDITKVFIICA
jgi:hypothetical protein